MLDVPPPPDMGALVQQLVQQFVAMASTVLTAIDGAVIEISRLAYVTILLIGLLLYFTHAERRLGKDLIKGGVLLAILSEFVFPALVKL